MIVGLGLAGSCLAMRAINKGLRVLVMNDDSMSSASQVAAGVMNPITGKRLVRTCSDRDLDTALDFYRSIESKLGVRLLFKRDMLRFITDQDMQKHYDQKREQLQYQRFFNQTVDLSKDHRFNQQGLAIRIDSVHHLDTQTFLESIQDYLKMHHMYHSVSINYDDLTFEDGVSYRDIKANRLVFCEGYQAKKNPFFKEDYLNAKGVYCDVEVPGLDLRKIYNHGKSLTPRFSSSTFYYGSTHIWDDMSPTPTPDQIEELGCSLDAFLNIDYQISNYYSGIRPILAHREAIYGWHRQYPLGIINGLAGQGCLLAPIVTDRFLKVSNDNLGVHRYSLKSPTISNHIKLS